MEDVVDAPDPHEPYTSRLFGILFNEELGAVIQVRRSDTKAVMEACMEAGMRDEFYVVAAPTSMTCIPHPARRGRGIRRVPRRSALRLGGNQLPDAGVTR